MQEQYYIEILKEWDSLDYSKNSDINHWLEWAVIEAILVQEHEELSYIQTSNVNYPKLPIDLTKAKDVMTAVRTTKKILITFEIPPKSGSRRTYLCIVADLLEEVLVREMDRTFARYAGDLFLRYAIPGALIFTEDE